MVDDAEEEALLPTAYGMHKTVHKHSFSSQLDNQVHAFQVAFFKQPPVAEELLTCAPAVGRNSTMGMEPLLTMEDLQLSRKTSEWLVVGLVLLPKLAWCACSASIMLAKHRLLFGFALLIAKGNLTRLCASCLQGLAALCVYIPWILDGSQAAAVHHSLFCVLGGHPVPPVPAQRQAGPTHPGRWAGG
jgi:hypothetical protein